MYVKRVFLADLVPDLTYRLYIGLAFNISRRAADFGYDDVRRVAEVLLGDHRPVVLAMRSSSDATCQRILDFTFGVCCASGATIEELGQKLFAVCPKGVKVSDVTMADLKRQGLMR